MRSETLPVDNIRTVFVILTLADPHGGESGETGEYTSSDPHTVLPFRRTDHLDFDVPTLNVGYVFAQSFCQSTEHGTASTQD